MKQKRKKVPYSKPGKRSLFKDIFTDAGRRAMNRAAEKEAEISLRTALKNPTDPKGKPVAAHLVKKIAAERLTTQAGSNLDLDFDFATNVFLSKLKYQWGCAPDISTLWKSFLGLVEEADPDHAAEFAKHYASAFRWSVAGHVHRLDLEYHERPEAIVTVEIWRKNKKYFSVGVQRNGTRRMMDSDRPPEHPMILFAGTKIHPFIAPKDFRMAQEMGGKRFLAALRSGKFKFSPRPEILVDQDSVLNIAPPTDEDLPEIRLMVRALGFRPKYRARTGA